MLHQHAAAAAVAREGGRSARRCAQRRLVRVPPRPTSEGEGGARSASPRTPGFERARRGTTRTERSARRTRHRRGPAGDQRPSHRLTDRSCRRLQRARRTTAPRRAAAGSTPAFSRRPDRNRAQRARAATDRTVTAGASPGRPIAASSTTARRRGPTARRGASARSWSGGTRRKQRVDRPRLADFAKTQAARLSAAGTTRRGDDGAARRRAVHHASRRRGLALGRRAASRTDRCRRTTSRSNRRSRIALYRAADQSRRPIGRSVPDNPYADSPGDPRYPVRADDLPADRASHGRRHVAHAVASGRAAAGALLRDLAGAGGAKSASRNGDWRRRITTPRGSIEARALVTARMRPLDVDGRTRAPGRPAVPLGPSRPRDRRRRQRSGRDLRGAERADHGNEGARLPDRAADAGPWRRHRGARCADHRVSHRLHALHRLQGVRGRVQGMERGPERRLRLDRLLVRQHRRRSATRRGAT